jgi:hypothetical protein
MRVNPAKPVCSQGALLDRSKGLQEIEDREERPVERFLQTGFFSTLTDGRSGTLQE